MFGLIYFVCKGYIGIDFFIFVIKLKLIWWYILVFVFFFKKICIFEFVFRIGEIYIFVRGYFIMVVSYSILLVNKFVSVNKDVLFLCLFRW